MLRCAICGSVRSRLFAGRSESFATTLLKLLPMDVRGADETLGLPRRESFVVDARLLLDTGLFHKGCGPVDSKSPIEKERFGMESGSSVASCDINGEEATPGSILSFVTASSSSSTLIPSSNSTGAEFTSSRADTMTGVYLRSGYTRRMGLGMPVELRLLSLIHI